jgi:hypothetical protein
MTANQPEILIRSIEPCGDAARIHYTASRDGISVDCGLITTTYGTPEFERVLEREAIHHLRDRCK